MDRTFPNKTTGRLFPRATETQMDLDVPKLTVGKTVNCCIRRYYVTRS